MDKGFERPANKGILDDREAAGLWKAIALSKDIGESARAIDLGVILELHRIMLAAAMPEIAGRFRRQGEDIKKLACVEPPPGVIVQERMFNFEKNLLFRLNHVGGRPEKTVGRKYKQWIDVIFELVPCSTSF